MVLGFVGAEVKKQKQKEARSLCQMKATNMMLIVINTSLIIFMKETMLKKYRRL